MSTPTYTDSSKPEVESSLQKKALREYLDEEDYQIFRALNEDGRMSDTELAERVGLSRTAVRRRRENLINEGLLEILAVIVLQEGSFAYGEVMVEFEPSVTADEWPEVIETFLDAELVYSVDVTMGEYDLILHVWHESFHELKTYVWELFDAASVVRDYEFFPVAKTYKAWDKVLERPR